jgi:hypothetical protein
MWEEFFESSKKHIPYASRVLRAAQSRHIFVGKFNEKRLNELIFLIGFANNKLDEITNRSDKRMLIENIEVGIAKFLNTKKGYKSSSSTYLAPSKFSKLKETILKNPGVLHNLEF